MSHLSFPGAPPHVSHSAMEDYQRCPASFELKRVLKVESNQMWIGTLGTAVHVVTEKFDLGELGDEPSDEEINKLFLESMDQAVQDNLDRSPNYTTEDWIATGGGKYDGEWALKFGPEAIRSYLTWRKRTGWSLATMADGSSAVEVPVEAELPGGPLIVGYIDRVFVMPNGKLCVVDLKNSSQHPDWKAQLGAYKVLWSMTYPDLDPIVYGCYWTSRSWGKSAEAGSHTTPVPLSDWTPEFLTGLYNGFIAGANAGSFNPRPSRMCSACTVRKHCPVFGSEPMGTLASVSS